MIKFLNHFTVNYYDIKRSCEDKNNIYGVEVNVDGLVGHHGLVAIGIVHSNPSAYGEMIVRGDSNNQDSRM